MGSHNSSLSEKYFKTYLSERTEFFILMKPEPLPEKSRTMPAGIVFFLLIVLVGVLLATGCVEPGQHFNHDIVVVKLLSDGSVDWSKTLDYGNDPINDSVAYKIVQTDDGSLVVYGRIPDQRHISKYGTHDTILKFSKSGDLVWELPLYPQCGRVTIIAGQNNEIVTVGPTICRINADGKIIWNRTPDIPGEIWSLIETKDGGYAIGGVLVEISPPESNHSHFMHQTFVAKLDSEGNMKWQSPLDDAKPPVLFYELDNDQGFYVQTSKDVIQLDNTGVITSSVSLRDTINATNSSLIKNIENKFNTTFPYAVSSDAKGAVRPLKDHMNANSNIFRTSDGGYFSAGFRLYGEGLLDHTMKKAQTGDLHAIKLRPDGTMEWDISEPNVSVNIVKQVIQTSDGGYAILCENEKFPR